MSGDKTADGPDDAEDDTFDRVLRPFDVGLQPERTALAWRRTALALVVGAVVGIRVLPTLLGVWAIIPAGAGIALAVGILLASNRRYQQQHQLLTTATTDRIALPDGTLPALVAGMTALAGLACILVVWSTAVHQLGELEDTFTPAQGGRFVDPVTGAYVPEVGQFLSSFMLGASRLEIPQEVL